jgi:hypothetical protein
MENKDLTKGCPKCKSTKFMEHIDKGIKEDVYNDDGYIVKEVITYEKDSGYVTCDGCKTRWDDYLL